MNKFLELIYSGEIRKNTDKKVIPPEEFTILLSAGEALEKAKEDIAFYLEKNKEKCAKLLEEAKESGFNQGLTEFNEHILYYQKQVKDLEVEVQKKILPLALKAAKTIVGDELQSHPDTIVNIIKKTLRTVTQKHHIKIFISKHDKNTLDSHKKDLVAILDQVKIFTIEESKSVEPGGCIIETETGIINASLDNQWAAIENAFKSFMNPNK